MIGQIFVVALLVAACTAYAAWSLAPRPVRRVAAAWLLKKRWPRWIAARLERHVKRANACGCDGCDRAPAARPTSTKEVAIVFQPRRR